MEQKITQINKTYASCDSPVHKEFENHCFVSVE